MSRRLKSPILAENLEARDILLDGRSLARLEDGRVVFVEGAVPGDIGDVEITGKEKKILLGKLKKLSSPSPDRVTPACSHFEDCGGCKWQHLDYARQLFYKEKYVRETLLRLGKIEPEETLPILGCDEPFWYRNKLEFSFARLRYFTTADMQENRTYEHSEACGFHVHGFHNKVLDIQECLLQKPVVNEIRNAVRQFAIEEAIPFYHPKDHSGFLRGIVFRTSEGTGELMVILIVADENAEWNEKLFGFLSRNFPVITSQVLLINRKLNNAYTDQEWRSVKGEPCITEHLGRWKFRISPVSFFQTNTRQTIRLYDVVRKYAGESRRRIIYDLYTGAGSIAMYVSDLADKVIGVEYAEDAVRDAKVNMQLNGLTHLDFFAGDMKKVLTPEFISAHGRPELLITDPPRAGMDEPVVQRILEMEPEEIIYVSCNPATQARDLALLSAKYRVRSICPVDMFPHTAHVENVAWLVRN